MRLILPVTLGLALLGCTSFREQPEPYADSTPLAYSGGASGTKTVEAVDTGYFLTDAQGGAIWMPGAPRRGPTAATIEANELRLKARELAAQLLETRSNENLMGLVALPTSFVELDNFTNTSSLGRYLSEAMYYEFNQRGFPIKEYRLDGKIRMYEAGGEFALTRNLPALALKESWAAVLVGTYLVEPNGVFINARLVRPADGLVLRTAQLVLPTSAMLTRMTARPPAPPFATRSIKIVSQTSGRSSTPSANVLVSKKKTATAATVAKFDAASGNISASTVAIPPNSPYTGSAPDQGLLPVPVAPEPNNPSLMDLNAPMPGTPKNG